ncbi:MAG: hypothetical protein K0S32_3790 [Bacteroidetes bacterium]|jgi:hypothetical protein|nr:hypothetical protein [Bacteroidota bacterium]
MKLLCLTYIRKKNKMKNYFSLLLLCFLSFTLKAQNCIHPNEIITSATTTIDQSGYTNITGCQNAGQYAVCDFTATGTYTLAGFGGFGSDYITFSNNSNVVVLSGNSPLVVTVTSTGLYRLHLSSNSSCGVDAFCHSVGVTGATPPVPSNDDCSSAISLSVPGNTTGTTVNGNTEVSVPATCGTAYSNETGVWYSVIGNGNKFGVSLCSTSWDSKIFVYSGTCGALTCVTGNDNNGPLCASSAASATWCSNPGMNYFILVAGASTTGTFDITMTQTVTTAPSVTVSASSQTLCTGQTATLTATGAATYSWNTSASSTSISVTPATSTTYTVTGFSSNGCANNTKTITVNVSSCTGVDLNGTGNENKIRLYPNPAQTQLYIEGENMQVEILNTLGEVIISGSQSGTTSYNLENYPSGIYMVKITVLEKQFIRKVLKQ